MTPHTWLGAIEDIAGTVAFLCSPRRVHQRSDHRRRWRLELTHTCPTSRCLRMGGPVNLFTVLDQAAAWYGDAVRCTSASGRFAAGATCATCTAPGHVDLASQPGGCAHRDRQREPAGDRADVRHLGRVRRRAHQLQAPRARDGQIIDDASATQVFASAKIAGELTSATDVPVEVVTGPGTPHGWPPTPRRCPRPIRRHWRGCSTPAVSTGRSKVRCCRTAT